MTYSRQHLHIKPKFHRVPMDRTIWVHIGATGPMNGQAQLGLGH